jgi:hypothetical protein
MSLADKYKHLDQTTNLADKYAHLNQDIQAKTSQEIPAEDLSQGRTILHHAPQAATLGLSDELMGAVESPIQATKTLANQFGDFFTPEETADYRKTRDAERELLAKLQEENPWTAGLSQVAGGLATLPLGGAIGAGAKGLMGLKGAASAAAPVSTALSRAVMTGLGEGAAYGMGQSESDSALGTLKDTAVGAGLGGAIGGATGLAGRALFGNIGDITSGALAKDTVKNKGLIGDLAQSRLGELMGTVVKSRKEGVDTSTLKGGEELASKAAATSTELIEKLKSRVSGIGKDMEENIANKTKDYVIPGIDEARGMTPMETVGDYTAIKSKKVTNLAADVTEKLETELADKNRQISEIIGSDADEVVNSLVKKPLATLSPEDMVTLENQMNLQKFNNETKAAIKNAILSNTNQLTDDVVTSILKKEAPQGNYKDILDGIKVKKEVDKLIKNAATPDGAIDPKMQVLPDLVDRRQAIKTTLNMAGKKTIFEPDLAIRKVISDFNTQGVPPGEEALAFKFKNIMDKYSNLDGTFKDMGADVSASKLMRNELNDFAKSEAVKFTTVGRKASELHETLKNFRSVASEGFSRKYHKAKVLQEVLDLDPENMSPEAIRLALADKLSGIFEKMNQPGSRDAANLRIKLQELEKMFPELSELIQKGQEQGSYFGLAGIKAGGRNLTMGDMARRYLAILPVEIFADVSNSAAGTFVKKTAGLANNIVLHGDSTALNYIAKKLEVNSPKASAMLKAAAETSDEGKKRAILNMLNQMPTFRQAFFNKGKNKEE